MTHLSGASLEVRRPEPCIDLATLVECLTDAVPLPGNPVLLKPHQRWPLFTWNQSSAGGALEIDTRAVISRLTTSPNAFQRLKLGPHAGFLRDAPVPRRRSRAHLGGRIVEGTGGQLRQALDHLMASVDTELARTGITDASLAALAADAPGEVLRELGAHIGCSVDDCLSGLTRLHRTTLETVGATQRSRHEEVARTMTAIEEITGDRTDTVERVATALGELLREDELTSREVATAIAAYRQQAETPGSQVWRFLDFLEDQALARVRLQVSFRLMEAIADAAADRLGTADAEVMQALIAYVRRASALFQVLGNPEGEDICLNLAREYGDQADFCLHDEVITVGFAGCLPVWPEWVAQLFEQQRRASDTPALHATVREVSYRFRVNGINPDGRLTAYQSRLVRMRACLLGEAEPQRVRRSLAELVFLSAVLTPAPTAGPRSRGDEGALPLTAARQLAERLERGGRPAVAESLELLEQQAARVDTLSGALVTVLRTGGPVITRGAEGRTWDYFVNVLRGLVDRQQIGHGLDRPLATDETPAREMIAFYRSIRVTHHRSMPSSLFSQRVRVRLGERSLLSRGETAVGQIARELPSRLVQVLWRPYQTTVGAEQASRAPLGPDPAAWQAPSRLELHYETRVLGKTHRSLDDQGEQLLAAFRTAFAVLCYVVLSQVLVRTRQAAGLAGRGDLALSMLRLHAGPADSDPLGGPQALFAAAQAIEDALAREVDVRMQGLVLDEALTEDKRRGVFSALFAGFPLLIERRVPKSSGYAMEPIIGLVTFGSRPCTSMPDQPDQSGDNLLTVRTCRAQAVTHQFADDAEPARAYRLWCDAVRTDIREAQAGEAVPPTAIEEIRRLYDLGCRHVLLLAHRYGGRRIGGSVRYRLHDHANTLAALATQLPDLYLYPLVRDTFPATRMRSRRASSEDAFEILAPDEHLAGPDGLGELRHDYTPVYSLATLHVIGEARKPQSGVCTYFLLREQGSGSIERTERIRANLLLGEGGSSTSGLRGDLVAVLRGLHYLEAERAPSRDHFFQPVLDPYRWLAPETHGHAGEIVVRTSRRRAGTVVLSLPAVLEHVSRAIHAGEHARSGGRP